jgi:hypothetical protein
MKISNLILGATALLALWQHYTNANVPGDDSRRAPEFPSQEVGRWINSTPLKMTANGKDGLAGKVVLLNVWTFM